MNHRRKTMKSWQAVLEDHEPTTSTFSVTTQKAFILILAWEPHVLLSTKFYRKYISSFGDKTCEHRDQRVDTISPLCVHFCSSCRDYRKVRKISHLIWLEFDPSVQTFRNWALPTALSRRSAYLSIMQQIIRVVIKLEPVELVRNEFANLWRSTSGSISARGVVKSRILLVVAAKPYFYMANIPHWDIQTNLFSSFRENNTRQTE
jgi:hypothetical protein